MKTKTLFACLLLAFPAFSQTSKKPNIIMIISDEHNASIMGCSGDPFVHTPNLDKLAAGGILFTSNYASSPICAPSRQSMTVGKYVSHHNVWANSGTSPNNIPSLPRILTQNGYDSYLVGGMHYNGMNYGLSAYTAARQIVPPADKKKRAEDLVPKPRKRIQAGVFKNNGTELGKEFHPIGLTNEMDKVIDVQRTKDALSFVNTRKQEDNPFFLIVGLNAPHYPLIAPKEYLDKYTGKIPMPNIPENYLEKLPLNYRHLRNERKFENVPADIVKLARESYYARVEWLDGQIGKILDALKTSAFSDNTIIIYTSDHGENLGEHGLWWKNCLYDCAAKVPLIINWSERWKGGQKRDQACGSVDLVQTIAALGGAKTPKDWDGDSLIPWLDNPAYRWKDMAISEYYADYISSGITMIRQGDWKYVYHSRADYSHGPETELFNLKTDPAELNNLAARPQYKDKIAFLHKALVKELGEEPEKTEQRWRNGANPEFPNGIMK